MNRVLDAHLGCGSRGAQSVRVYDDDHVCPTAVCRRLLFSVCQPGCIGCPEGGQLSERVQHERGLLLADLRQCACGAVEDRELPEWVQHERGVLSGDIG